MSMLKELQEMARAYQAMYGTPPTHVTINPDEEKRLELDLLIIGKYRGLPLPKSLHGERVMGMEIRVSGSAPDGHKALPPTEVLK